MQLIDHITFAADFPDDSAWDADGLPLVPGGGGIALALVAGLAAEGLVCSSPVQHQFYGWAFDVALDDVSVWCLLQYVEPWLLLTECNRTARKATSQLSIDAHERVLSALLAVMRTDNRFSHLRTWTKDQFEGRGDRS